jgi:hypothetical protein
MHSEDEKLFPKVSTWSNYFTLFFWDIEFSLLNILPKIKIDTCVPFCTVCLNLSPAANLTQMIAWCTFVTCGIVQTTFTNSPTYFVVINVGEKIQLVSLNDDYIYMKQTIYITNSIERFQAQLITNHPKTHFLVWYLSTTWDAYTV